MRSLFSALKDEKGLSLLEAALVLTLIGIVSAAALPYLTFQRTQAQVQKTLSHQEVIFKSLASYALSHGNLPCPAVSFAKGQAREHCQDGGAVGVVPYATLGLAADYAQDGWGHPYIYAVNATLTDIQPLDNKKQMTDFLKELCLKTNSPLTLLLPGGGKASFSEEDPLAVILISRGEAAHHPQGKGELQNEAADLRFAAYPYCTKKESPHRHRLKWWTRNNFLSHYAHFSCPNLLLMLALKEDRTRQEPEAERQENAWDEDLNGAW